jgi:tetratricopeptide (TPR) repeat protein
MLELKKIFKWLVYFIFSLSIVLLVIVNFYTVWVVIGLFALIFFIYLISFDRFALSKKFSKQNLENVPNETNIDSSAGTVNKRRVSYNSLAVILVSLIFIFSGSIIGQKIADSINVLNVEVRPSWVSTLNVIKDGLASDFLFGRGPNTFSNLWVEHKPEGINNTIFWNVDFTGGIGLIPSFFATTGLVGVLTWLFFFAVLLWTGVRSIFQPVSDLFSRYLLTSSFFVTMFLWVIAIVYIPSIVIFVLAFFFLGLFIASLYREGLLSSKALSLSHNPKLSFVSVVLLVVLMLLNLTLGYVSAKKSWSVIQFEKSAEAFQVDQDFVKAGVGINKAISLGGYDTYYRGLSELYLTHARLVLASTEGEVEVLRNEFQQNIASSIESARKATEVSPENYQNWLALARVYSTLVPAPLSIPGAYENAKATYDKARSVNATSPLIPVFIARLEADNNDLIAARKYVNEAILLKSNYADAHFLLAQIEVIEGNLSNAIVSLETTIVLSPNNPGLLFQLGLLKYNDSDWNGAIEAFAQAINIVPEYANAKYFLGLALDRVGNREEAVKQFEDLMATNPDNTEIDLILTNLKNNEDPFTGATPPIDNRPEQRPELPIEDNN